MTETDRKVLLIGWDAADWEVITPLIEEGLMPTLDGLINRGVMGNLASLQPMLSPMLWNSVATGKFADKHGISGFIEPDPVNGGARPFTSISRKCKAFWNILSQSGLTSNVVGWWASHPAEPIKGNVVTNAFSAVDFDPVRGWRVPAGSIHPPERAKELAHLRVFPGEISEEEVLTFIPHAAEVDQQLDRHLVSFAKILSDAATIHTTATTLMQNHPADLTAVYYDAIDHFSHAFMNYHPPRLSWVNEKEFEVYRDVVRGVYRFHDMMLETLLRFAGPETTVILCSDHGFESGVRRPRGTPREPTGPAIWHRSFGVFVMAGPGIKRDERIYGASLIDICPTVLTLFGLPVGKDMDGRPLLEAFETPPDVETIESWEDVPGDSGAHAAGVELDPMHSQELMEQFAALGYIENPSEDKDKQAASATIESKYNLAQVYLWKGDADRAIPLLEEIVRLRPWEERFLHRLAAAYFRGGYLGQSERVISAIGDGESPRASATALLLAQIRFARGDYGRSLQYVQASEAMNPQSAALHARIGDAYARLRRWNEAEAAYEKTLAADPNNAFAFQGLSNVYRRKGLNEKTVDAALRAVSLLHRLPLAHFNLGVALSRLGEPDRARIAFETALRFRPEMVNAHRYLAALLQSNGGDPEAARFHREEVQKFQRRRRSQNHSRDERVDQIFELPDIPPSTERNEILLRERPDPPSEGQRSGKNFILVSGLPRSGTSLMMQMLQAGGVKILTDGERGPDTDNPKGYLEWEPIKTVRTQPDLLDADGLDGCAIKCISMLLPHMPLKHNYKVIFMTRPIDEVVRSQNKMVERLGTKGAEMEIDQLARSLTNHRNETRTWLARVPHMQFLELDYPSVLRDPAAAIARLVDFLGADRLTAAEAMAAVIDHSLHRQKITV